MQEVADMAVNAAPGALAQVQVTALFSLGNMANHAAMVAEMRRLQIEQPVEQLLCSTSSEIVKNAQRLHMKLRAMSAAREQQRREEGAQVVHGGPQPLAAREVSASPGAAALSGVSGATQGVERMGMRTPAGAAR
jgi:hypothetical protein